MKWEEKTLGDVSVAIQTGPFGSQLHQSDYSTDGIPVVMPKDMLNGKIVETSIARVSDDHVKRLGRHKIECGDILYSRRGDVGRCAFATPYEEGWLCGTGCLKVSIDKNKADARFIFFQLQRAETIGWVQKHAVGSTMLNLNTSILSSVPVYIPKMEVQYKIASILSAYDDLIENNQKQIKLLEEAAQRLYKEWFVDLRFPGYEDVKIVDGVPEGWKKGHINELITYDIGGGWGEESSSSECQVPAFVIRGTDFDSLAKGDMENIPFRYHKESNYCKRKLEEGDIVFEVSGGSKNEGVARTIFVTKSLLNGLKNSVICASFCKLVRPKKGFSKYLYDSFRYMRSCHITEQYDKRSASSIVNFRWQEFLVQEMVLIPSHNVLNQYNDLSLNINKIIERKVETCNLAKEARDRLLPKLMSGEIEV